MRAKMFQIELLTNTIFPAKSVFSLLVCAFLLYLMAAGTGASASSNPRAFLENQNDAASHDRVTGEAWSPMGYGLNVKNLNQALAVTAVGEDIYVGGRFYETCGNATCDSGNIGVNGIAKWNGSTWSALGFGVAGYVSALAASGNDLYVGGVFDICGNTTCDSGNITVNSIAKWNGSTWSALGYGVYGDVSAIAVSGDDIYVGGFFRWICGNPECEDYSDSSIPVNGIAKWNGTTWSPLGYGFRGSVKALAVSGNDLYAGGNFFEACGEATCTLGNVRVGKIAKWNGSTWSALGSGLNGDVLAIVESGGDLFVGGDFSRACGNTTCDNGNVILNRIAKWNGSVWESLGGGVESIVSTLAVRGNKVYAGGGFWRVCGDVACDWFEFVANNVAEWNGAAWSKLGNGVNSYVFALVSSPDNSAAVYAVGYFTQACANDECANALGNITVNGVAKYGTISCSAKPPKPILLKPDNTTQPPISGKKVKLDWDTTACADRFKVVLKQGSKRGTNIPVKGDPTKSQVTVKGLPSGFDYYWRVAAVNEFGKTKSKWGMFRTK